MKEENEIDMLEAELAELIKDLDMTPQPYYTHIDTDYVMTGSYTGLVRYSPTVNDCAIDLQFVACVLRTLGKDAVSDEIDEIAKKLNVKE